MNYTRKKILIIIPAYQEEASIARVVNKIRTTLPFVDIVVINDGSTDRTSANAKATGVAVVDLPFNLGIGGAMQTGYRYAERNGYEIAVQIDADGQHNPGDLTKLLAVMEQEDMDMVIGSRFVESSGYRPSLSRAAGITLLSWLVSMVTGKTITDTTSGYRAVNRKVIKLFARDYPTDYPEVEVLILLHKHRLRVKEVPVIMNYRETGASSITPLKSIYYMIKVILSVLIMVTRTRSQVASDG
ncbi:MAG: glycosyltransferase family 2 protein [Clostridia bacterium]|nr:glycosyltransferase family 2 protein [Clostridia bacterium]